MSYEQHIVTVHTLSPVSYTHLDVYKRQVVALANINAARSASRLATEVAKKIWCTVITPQTVVLRNDLPL